MCPLGDTDDQQVIPVPASPADPRERVVGHASLRRAMEEVDSALRLADEAVDSLRTALAQQQLAPADAPVATPALAPSSLHDARKRIDHLANLVAWQDGRIRTIEAERGSFERKYRQEQVARVTLQRRFSDQVAELRALTHEAPARMALDRVPRTGSLGDFIEGLIAVSEWRGPATSASAEDLEAFTQFVYSAPPCVEVFAPGPHGYSPPLLHQIIAVQSAVHDRLVEMGLRLIFPRPGDAFDPSLHEAADASIVWGPDHAKDSQVCRTLICGFMLQSGASTLRPGVLRRARVQRYAFDRSLTARDSWQCDPHDEALPRTTDSTSGMVWGGAIQFVDVDDPDGALDGEEAGSE